MRTPYYEDANVTLFHGDCREILPQLEPVEHVITDPPYSEHVHGKQRRGGSAHRSGVVCDGRELGFEALDDETRAACATTFRRMARRWVLVFSDVESTFQWRADLTRAGLEYVRTGVWVKLGSPPQFSGDRPAQGFETVTICHPQGCKRWNGGGLHAVWTHPIVTAGSGHGQRLHTTQKPEALMSELVAQFTDADDTILDPFMGSGTTLVAAKRLGRKAIGIEKEEKYCEIAARRLAQGALDLFGGEQTA